MEKAKVYFIKEITPENIIKAYEALGKNYQEKLLLKCTLVRKEIKII